MATETDRTLFFDFLPMELGTIRGMKVRVQLYTVPGQVFTTPRRIVLRRQRRRGLRGGLPAES